MESNSITNQKQILSDFARREGYRNTMYFVDDGISGTTFQREGFQKMQKMVEDGRDCSEVLIQLSAVRSAINNIGKVILEDHIQHCIVDAVELGDQEAIANLCQAIDKFVK